jgi:hypothetical protein
MKTLWEAGAQKVLHGQTTPREVLAVAPPEQWHGSCRNSTPEGFEIAKPANLLWANAGR